MLAEPANPGSFQLHQELLAFEDQVKRWSVKAADISLYLQIRMQQVELVSGQPGGRRRR